MHIEKASRSCAQRGATFHMSPDLRRDLSQSTSVSHTGIVGTGSTINVDTLKPDTLLRRKQLAEALSVAGFPIAVATLSTMASRGGGPPFQLWGRLPLYAWGCALHGLKAV